MAVLVWVLLASAAATAQSAPQPPIDNPFHTLYPQSTDFEPYAFSSTFNWSCVAPVSGTANPQAEYQQAVAKLESLCPSGGVVYFPAGTYKWSSSFHLSDRFVVRGEPTSAKANDNGAPGSLKPSTIFAFPDRAAQGIECINCSLTGIVNIDVDGGHIAIQGRPATAGLTAAMILSNRVRNYNYLVSLSFACKQPSTAVLFANEPPFIFVLQYPVSPPATFYQEWPYR
jgi:hypothetical protein